MKNFSKSQNFSDLEKFSCLHMLSEWQISIWCCSLTAAPNSMKLWTHPSLSGVRSLNYLYSSHSLNFCFFEHSNFFQEKMKFSISYILLMFMAQNTTKSSIVKTVSSLISLKKSYSVLKVRFWHCRCVRGNFLSHIVSIVPKRFQWNLLSRI